MGQHEVLKMLLSRPGEYMTRKEIQEKINHGQITRDLRKLWSKNLIEIQTNLTMTERFYKAKESILDTQTHNTTKRQHIKKPRKP